MWDSRWTHRIVGGVVVLCACRCASPPANYATPTLPAEQLGLIEFESRATVEAVDGHPLGPGIYGEIRQQVYVSPMCHELVAKYEESYVRSHIDGAVMVLFWSPAAAAASLGASAASMASSSTLVVHEYETDMPIHFFVPAKANTKYWLTSTFDGDHFSPRIAVLDRDGQRTGVIFPNQPCGTAAKAH